MRYYDEKTKLILSTKGVRKAVSPATLPKYFTIENLKGFKIKPFYESSRPEIKDQQVLVQGEITKTSKGYTIPWVVKNKSKVLSKR